MRHIRSSIRIVTFTALTVFLYLTWFVGAFVIPNKQYWRQIAFQLWSKGFLSISGMNVELVGIPPRPPFILVANHLSYVDIPAFRAVVEAVFVAKHEVRSWPLFGRVVRDMGTIFINRTNRRDIPRAGAEIIDRLEDGEGVIIFPEGTSSKGEMVLPFNSSLLEFAARRNLPVHYASITYKMSVADVKASEFVCWWDETVFLEHLWRLFSIPQFTAVINFGEVPVKLDDRKELAHVLRESVTKNFIPVS